MGSFTLENKVAWEELSPSLQARFKNIQSMIDTGLKKFNGQKDNSDITMSRKAPMNPINNKSLWIDEKYRVARAFTENYWEFTRAAWANGDYSNAPDPGTTDPGVPDIDVPTYTPKKHNIHFATWTETATSGSLTPGPDCQSVNSDGEINVGYAFTGSNCSITYTFDISKCHNTDKDLLGYLFYAYGPASDYSVASETISVFKITLPNIRKLTSIGNGKYKTVISCNSGTHIKHEIESKQCRLSVIMPGDQAVDALDIIKVNTSDYPYYIPVSKIGIANVIPNYADAEGGGSKPVGDYIAINGTISLSIDLEETY